MHLSSRISMKRIISFAILFCSLFLLTGPINAQELEGVGTIRFVLEGPDETPDVVGDWTLIRPGNERTKGADKEYTFTGLPAGNYSFTTTSPQGASAKTELLLDGQLIKSVNGPQVGIPLDGQENYLIKVKYTYTRAGTVAVNSTPKGLSFRLTGPNNMEKTGTTPYSLENVPEGQYTAYFDQIDGCPSLPAQSDKLEKDSRIALKVTVVCDNLVVEDTSEKQLIYVTVNVDGREIIFEDVPLGQWFSGYIHTAAKTRILTGYNDSNGNPTGRFGPGDNVTVAQLSKVAHVLAQTDEENMRGEVQNTQARNQWFEQYFASAEQRHWEVWRDTRVNPSRPATRAEVVATLLRAMGIRTVWAEGKMFADVRATHPYANAIETAGADGLLDVGGNFRPDDPINRAELAKLTSSATELYIENTLEVQGKSSY